MDRVEGFAVGVTSLLQSSSCAGSSTSRCNNVTIGAPSTLENLEGEKLMKLSATIAEPLSSPLLPADLDDDDLVEVGVALLVSSFSPEVVATGSMEGPSPAVGPPPGVETGPWSQREAACTEAALSSLPPHFHREGQQQANILVLPHRPITGASSAAAPFSYVATNTSTTTAAPAPLQLGSHTFLPKSLRVEKSAAKQEEEGSASVVYCRASHRVNFPIDFSGHREEEEVRVVSLLQCVEGADHVAVIDVVTVNVTPRGFTLLLEVGLLIDQRRDSSPPPTVHIGWCATRQNRAEFNISSQHFSLSSRVPHEVSVLPVLTWAEVEPLPPPVAKASERYEDRTTSHLMWQPVELAPRLAPKETGLDGLRLHHDLSLKPRRGALSKSQQPERMDGGRTDTWWLSEVLSPLEVSESFQVTGCKPKTVINEGGFYIVSKSLPANVPFGTRSKADPNSSASCSVLESPAQQDALMVCFLSVVQKNWLALVEVDIRPLELVELLHNQVDLPTRTASGSPHTPDIEAQKRRRHFAVAAVATMLYPRMTRRCLTVTQSDLQGGVKPALRAGLHTLDLGDAASLPLSAGSASRGNIELLASPAQLRSILWRIVPLGRAGGKTLYGQKTIPAEIQMTLPFYCHPQQQALPESEAPKNRLGAGDYCLVPDFPLNSGAIGAGGWGDVTRCVDQLTGRRYVVKTFRHQGSHAQTVLERELLALEAALPQCHGEDALSYQKKGAGASSNIPDRKPILHPCLPTYLKTGSASDTNYSETKQKRTVALGYVDGTVFDNIFRHYMPIATHLKLLQEEQGDRGGGGGGENGGGDFERIPAGLPKFVPGARMVLLEQKLVQWGLQIFHAFSALHGYDVEVVRSDGSAPLTATELGPNCSGKPLTRSGPCCVHNDTHNANLLIGQDDKELITTEHLLLKSDETGAKSSSSEMGKNLLEYERLMAINNQIYVIDWGCTVVTRRAAASHGKMVDKDGYELVTLVQPRLPNFDAPERDSGRPYDATQDVWGQCITLMLAATCGGLWDLWKEEKASGVGKGLSDRARQPLLLDRMLSRVSDLGYPNFAKAIRPVFLTKDLALTTQECRPTAADMVQVFYNLQKALKPALE